VLEVEVKMISSDGTARFMWFMR